MKKVVFLSKSGIQPLLSLGDNGIPLFPRNKIEAKGLEKCQEVSFTCSFILNAFSILNYPKGSKTPELVSSLGVGVSTARGAPWPYPYSLLLRADFVQSSGRAWLLGEI